MIFVLLLIQSAVAQNMATCAPDKACCESLLEPMGAYAHSRVVRAIGVEGELTYHVDPTNPSLLVIEDLEVEPRGRGGGYSDAMLARALLENPGVNRVKGTFVGTNRERVLSELAKGRDCVHALLATPGARMRIRFGFTSVEEAICEPKAANGFGFFRLTLARPN